tara:strand:- start:43 stop:2907 length:2865 start_codon:yes stop_codon:yes gene_type:complete
MPDIQVEIRPGEFAPFEISGEKPNYVEMKQIEKLVMEMERSDRSVSFDSGSENEFDTETGIKDSSLRRQLGGAETSGEEELVLGKFGFREGDYVRDDRGNLAITPSGALLLGIETEKPIMIDESGFSLADLQDFVGAAGEEIVGGIGGAIAGQAVIPIPILGAAIGAAIGSGSGKLVEEGVETLRGTQEQTLGEVGKDALIEAAIAGAGEGIFGVVFKGFGSIAGRGRVGSKLDPQTQKDVATAIESNYKPSLSAMGANSIVSRQQALAEKALGTSKRLRENHDQVMTDLGKLRSYGADGGVDIEATAAILTNAVEAGDNFVLQSERMASENLLKHMDDIAVSMGKVAKKDGSLDADIQNSFVGAYKAFDDKVKEKFANIENLTNNAVGDTALFNTRGLKADANLELERLVAAGSGNLGKSRMAVDELMKLPDDASFTQVYKARKALNDTWMGNYGSDSVAIMKDKFLNKLDDFVSPDAVKNAVRRKAARDLTPDEKRLMMTVSKEIPKVRDFFRRGMDSFEKVSGAASLKSLNNAVKGQKELNPKDAFKRLIQNDNPKLLKDARQVLKDDVFEPLRERAAGEWMRKAMRDSGSTLDATKKFSGNVFKEKLETLGGTADELFGSKIGQVRKLADQLDSLSLTRVDQSVINDFIASGGDDAGVDLLKNVKDILAEKAQFDKAVLARKLRAGSLMPDEAADLLASPSVKGNDITKLSKFFENSPQEMAEIRSYYMQNLIGDFESSFMSDKKSFRALADRLVKAKKSGKLDAIFPKEEADAIELFGRNMQVLGKSAEGGDLVAANIAANPLENIGTIARLGLVGQVLSTGPFYTSFAAKYGKESAKESTKSGKMRVFLNVLNQTSQSFAKQSTARGAYGLGSAASNEADFQVDRIKSSIMPSTPSVRRTSVPIPEVSPVMEMPPMPDGSQSSIRDRVRDNPALAASLLGGLENIGFV